MIIEEDKDPLLTLITKCQLILIEPIKQSNKHSPSKQTLHLVIHILRWHQTNLNLHIPTHRFHNLLTQQIPITILYYVKQMNNLICVRLILNNSYHIFVLIVMDQYVQSAQYTALIDSIKFKLQEKP